jgi:LPXTG-motif cell wall-anchored protein
MNKRIIAFVLALLLVAPTTIAMAEGESDIVDTAVAAGNFTTLVAAVQAAGLVDTLKGDGPFTVFAPTDAAFTALLSDLGLSADELLASENLKDILLYHVVPGKVMSTDLVDGTSVETAGGASITVTLDPVQVNDSNVTAADIEASNGVIHVIDKVLTRPIEDKIAEPTTTSETTADIVDTAIAAGSFTTLVAALQKAELVDALKGEGPFTVFAPTDDAFAALLSSLGVTAEELLNRSDLSDILLYHVVKGKVLSTDLVDGMEASTLNGKKVIITLNPAKVNDSNIATTDIQTTNGVIHVIDAVLLPPADQTNTAVPKTGDQSQFIYLLLASITGIGLFVYFTRRRLTN